MNIITQLHEITPEDLQGYLLEGIRKSLKEFQEVSNSKNHSKFLTRKDVCDIFSISLPTLHNWVKEGKINSYRLGNRVYFKPDEIEHSLKQIKF